MSVFEMSIDTIFICFCEDYETNDGIEQPYFMSPELMEVMQNLKGYYGQKFEFGNKLRV